MIGRGVEVRDEAGPSAARLLARATAAEAGLSVPLAETLAIIASELATNQRRYAVGGQVWARTLVRDGVAGVELEAWDRGPGIADVTRAFAGESRPAGSLGVGLAAVWRLAHEVDVDVRAGEGTRILVRVFSGPVRRRPTVAIVGRGLATEPISGDAAGFWRLDDALLIVLVDGLGHGVAAREAADRALAVADADPGSQPEALMAACGAALRGSRGAVIAIGRFEDGAGAVESASIGNIQMGVWNRGIMQRVLPQSGIVGATSARPARPAGRLLMPPGAAMVMATDGTHDPLGDLVDADVHARSPWALAQRIVERRGKAHDDAMVVVVK